MNVSDAIKQRRSVRAYQDKPVAPELLEKIFLQAQDSASNCNTQPWHVVVVSGNSRDKIEKAMMTEIMGGAAPTPHFTPGDHGLNNEYRNRQIACAVSLYGAMDIKKEDKQKRQELMVRNWQFFWCATRRFFLNAKDNERNQRRRYGYLSSVYYVVADRKWFSKLPARRTSYVHLSGS